MYDIYASYSDSLDLACGEQCCYCCTRNVTLTTLEAADILGSVDPANRKRLLRHVHEKASIKRFQPQITINEMAWRCARGDALPEEQCDPDWGPCPLLDKRSCPLYAFRPFACRCMISRILCDQTGHADMDEFALTVNSVFLQVVEHLDSGGCTGNLTDVFLHLSKPKHWLAYRQGRLDCGAANLIRNRTATVLMIPPGHRAKAAPLLQQLQRLAFV